MIANLDPPHPGIYIVTKCYVPDAPGGPIVPYRIVYLGTNGTEYKTTIKIHHTLVKILNSDQVPVVEIDSSGNATSFTIYKGFCTQIDFRKFNW